MIDDPPPILLRGLRRAIDSLPYDSSFRGLPRRLQLHILGLLVVALSFSERNTDRSNPSDELLADLYKASHQASELSETVGRLLKAEPFRLLRVHKLYLFLQALLIQASCELHEIAAMTAKPGRLGDALVTEMLVQASLLLKHSTGQYGDSVLADLAQHFETANLTSPLSQDAIKMRRERFRIKHPQRFATANREMERLYAELTDE